MEVTLIRWKVKYPLLMHQRSDDCGAIDVRLVEQRVQIRQQPVAGPQCFAGCGRELGPKECWVLVLEEKSQRRSQCVTEKGLGLYLVTLRPVSSAVRGSEYCRNAQ